MILHHTLIWVNFQCNFAIFFHFPTRNRCISTAVAMCGRISSHFLLGKAIRSHFGFNMNRVYHTALAIVPANHDVACWTRLQEIRHRLQDKGYYRWPPHINLFYPFIDSCDFQAILPQIAHGLKDLTPFQVHLDEFGTFGGRDRGVCFLSPQPDSQIGAIYSSIQLILQETSSKPFHPHMTVTHCANGNEARDIAARESETWEPLSFLVDAVYVLQRDGLDGQYFVAAKLPFGSSVVEEGPMTFDHMPTEQEDWIKERGGRRNRKK
jgi:2'-5' RNA ligase